MANQPFKFKEFTVHQNQCAMKIGTDSVLLGAWANLKHNPYSILDIGAGTGILALMLAQRSGAQVIDALEIDDNAYEQCVANFEASPWSDRLFCYHASLVEFMTEIEDTYDVIISNPPFYSEAYKTGKIERDLARFTEAMPFEHLISAARKLLSEDGKFVVIIPFKEEAHFINLSKEFGLFPNQILHVKGHNSSPTIRSLIEFSFNNLDLKKTELIIEKTRQNYTEDYINLTKDFYLKM
ncbi:MAG: methyltransferase [Flavobacteriaceae bacterium]|nr:methyltransferase [Flavobacteriaceae bacterium]